MKFRAFSAFFLATAAIGLIEAGGLLHDKQTSEKSIVTADAVDAEKALSKKSHLVILAGAPCNPASGPCY